MEDLKEGLYRMFRNNFLVHISFHVISRISASVFGKFGEELIFFEAIVLRFLGIKIFNRREENVGPKHKRKV
jgi:hypothetical protein